MLATAQKVAERPVEPLWVGGAQALGTLGWRKWVGLSGWNRVGVGGAEDGVECGEWVGQRNGSVGRA